jgi:hypothetical protein
MDWEKFFDILGKFVTNVKVLLALGGLMVGALVTGFTLKQRYDELRKSYKALLPFKRTSGLQMSRTVNGQMRTDSQSALQAPTWWD